MSDTTRRFLAFLLPSAAVATLVCLIVVVALQQELRQAADDPQHQLAEDAVIALDAGAPASSVVGSGRIDIAVSLAPFLAVHDASGRLLATDGQLDGAAPGPPSGVLDTARVTGVDRVTWQPRSGVRVALVVLRWSGGTVFAGRSLRRVEEEESAVEGIVALGWLATLAVLCLAAILSARLWPRRAQGMTPQA
jgi:hypothetical protein